MTVVVVILLVVAFIAGVLALAGAGPGWERED